MVRKSVIRPCDSGLNLIADDLSTRWLLDNINLEKQRVAPMESV